MPKVSIIVPNYNHEKFLPKRFQSIFCQTFTDFEVICLDDFSTDNSREIIKKVAQENNIQLIFNQVNSGSPFKQWNKGVRQSTGEYIWIAESDDFADCRFLERLVAIMEENRDVGLAYCQSWIVDETDQPQYINYQWTSDLDPERWENDFINNGKDELCRYLITKNTIPNASAVLIRRTLYNSLGGAPEDLSYCGDWYFWVKALLSSDVAYVSEPLNYFREAHGKSVRKHVLDSGIRIHENLKVIHLIKSHVPINYRNLRKSVLTRFNQWKNINRRGDIPWWRQKAIIALFEELLPELKWQIYIQLPVLFLKHFRGSNKNLDGNRNRCQF